MANKKKTVEDEVPSTTKGITKANTTRTQKIIAKTKTPAKRTTAKSTVKNTKSTTTKSSKAAKPAKITSTRKTTKKSATKKPTTKKTTKKSSVKKLTANDKITANTVLVQDFNQAEYYDLPFTYNQTVVKILAQTPETLFVYWDISVEDRKKYVEQYGENFFNETRPVLIITNKTMGYSFEVEINDFANSWYLHVNDAKCEYNIELGRRPITKMQNIPTDYVYISSSNVIEAPNDHILFEKKQNMVYFKNVKTNQVSHKNVATLAFIKNMGKIYNIYDLYKQIYHDEELNILSNPSSNPSSDFMINNLN